MPKPKKSPQRKTTKIKRRVVRRAKPKAKAKLSITDDDMTDDDRSEVAKAIALARMRSELSVWHLRQKAEIEYDAGQTRFTSRKELMSHVPIPPTRWRPGMDTTEVALIVVDLYAQGHTLSEIRRAHAAYPSPGTLRKWAENDAEFHAEYQIATEAHIQSRAALSVIIASGAHRVYDDSVTVGRDKVHSDAMLKSAQFIATRHTDSDGVHAGTWADLIASAEEEELRGNGNGHDNGNGNEEAP